MLTGHTTVGGRLTHDNMLDDDAISEPSSSGDDKPKPTLQLIASMHDASGMEGVTVISSDKVRSTS